MRGPGGTSTQHYRLFLWIATALWLIRASRRACGCTMPNGATRGGEAIVCLHAYVDSWFSYSRVLPLLSAEYHAFAPDQRGHGDSDKPECCYTADDYAADVNAFMDAVRVEKATLVGDSSGGLIAQRVTLDYPQRVGRLVLIGSPTTLVDNETVIEFGKEILALEDPVPPEFVREGL